MRHITRHLITLISSLGLVCGTGRAASTSRVILPLVPGWHNGAKVLYIQTEASDPGVAQDQMVNYVPRLASSGSSNIVDDIYVITNFPQPNVVPSAPHPLGPQNSSRGYSPLWQVNLVTWNEGATPQALTSEAAISDAMASGKVAVKKTDIVVNCPIVFTPDGGTLPTATIIGDEDHKQVILPLVQGWYKGTQVLYLQTEASDPAVALDQNVNYVPGLTNAVGTRTVDDIYVVSNFQQANVVASAPHPLGPQNADEDYSPLWHVKVVTWNEGATPQLLTSEGAIQDAASNGKVKIDGTRIVVNCPIMAGAVPTATIIGMQSALKPMRSAPGGSIQMTLSGQVGQTYPIQASTNLIDWLVITNLALTGPTAQFADPAQTQTPRRFYRAVDQ